MDDDKTVSAEEARGLLECIEADAPELVDERVEDVLHTLIAMHAEADALRARVEKLERRPSEAAVRHDAERCLLMLLWDAIDGEQDGDAPGNREMRDNLIARVREKAEAVEAERDEARETNKRLHRRVQQAEGDAASLRCLIPVGTPHRNDVVEFMRAYTVGAKVWGADGKPAFTGQSVRGVLWPLHEWVAHVVAERDEARRERGRLARIDTIQRQALYTALAWLQHLSPAAPANGPADVDGTLAEAIDAIVFTLEVDAARGEVAGG